MHLVEDARTEAYIVLSSGPGRGAKPAAGAAAPLPPQLLTGDLRAPPPRGPLSAAGRRARGAAAAALARALDRRSRRRVGATLATNQACLVARAAMPGCDAVAPKVCARACASPARRTARASPSTLPVPCPSPPHRCSPSRQFCRTLGFPTTLGGPLSGWIARRAARLIAARVAWFDRVLAGALDAGATQVVLLAAGYDSSAYRLARPGVRFFEVDLPPVSAAKRGLVAAALPGLAPSALPTYIGADLAAVPLGEALAPAGFDPAARTLWVAQGLSMYLPPEALSGMLSAARRLSGPGSAFACDLLNSGWRRAAPVAWQALLAAVAARGEPMLCAAEAAAPGALAALAAAHGWRLGAVGARCGGADASARGAVRSRDMIACVQLLA
jgi:methyltransferase (TIGR00027 family)